MGELSKSIGEKGERITNFLFENILNFNALLENQTISCNKGQKHQIKTREKKTHGIDGIVSCKSPLEDFCLEIGVISSKYTEAYPNSPNNLFKSHFKDLAYTLECFNNSKLKNDISQRFSNVNKTEVIGILVWLSNKDDNKFDLISKLNNITIDNNLIFDKIILIDNYRYNFLFESIYKTKLYFGEDNVDFVYHNTGINIYSIQNQSYGKIFPLHYLYSNIIPLRVQNSNHVEFHIYINEDFQENQFSKILDFAKSFDHLNTVDKLILNFLAYDSLSQENKIREKLINFSNYKLNKNLVVQKFPIDFRNN